MAHKGCRAIEEEEEELRRSEKIKYISHMRNLSFCVINWPSRAFTGDINIYLQ
jgi:hypothetical protein